jgi:hypothetical protein
MSSSFFTATDSVIVSNRRFSSLIELALLQANECATSRDELASVEEFQTELEGFYPGYDLDLEVKFRTKEEKQFWAQVFQSVALVIEAEGLGNSEDRTWASSAASDARRVSELLAASESNAT